jgi:hypothetical protein
MSYWRLLAVQYVREQDCTFDAEAILKEGYRRGVGRQDALQCRSRPMKSLRLAIAALVGVGLLDSSAGFVHRGVLPAVQGSLGALAPASSLRMAGAEHSCSHQLNSCEQTVRENTNQVKDFLRLRRRQGSTAPPANPPMPEQMNQRLRATFEGRLADNSVLEY